MARRLQHSTSACAARSIPSSVVPLFDVLGAYSRKDLKNPNVGLKRALDATKSHLKQVERENATLKADLSQAERRARKLQEATPAMPVAPVLPFRPAAPAAPQEEADEEMKSLKAKLEKPQERKLQTRWSSS